MSSPTQRFFPTLALSIVFCTLSPLFADTTKTKVTEFGVYLSGNFTGHSPSFLSAAVQSPDNFLSYKTPITPFTFGFGASMDYLFDDVFGFTGRIGYHSISADLAASEKTKLDTGGATLLVGGTTKSDISYFELTPGITARNFLGFPKELYLLAGFEIGIPLSSDVSQEIRVVSGATTTTTASGISDLQANTRLALAFGAGYSIPLSASLVLKPELSYRIPLSEVSNAVQYQSWKADQLRLSVTLQFGSATVADSGGGGANRTELKVAVKEVNGIDARNTASALRQINVEDTQYTELFPLVPYQFFRPNSATPTKEYDGIDSKSERGNFSLDGLPLSGIDINRNILNIIGTRLTLHPSATLTITGTNDGKEELKVKQLSLQRATVAKSFLTTQFGIDPSRISVEARDLSERASSGTVEMGTAENRRVEFKSNSPEILSPIVLKGENDRLATPGTVEFVPEIQADSIVGWTMTVLQAGDTLSQTSGIGHPSSQAWRIRPNQMASKQVPVDYVLDVTDSYGERKSAVGSIPVEYLSSTKKNRQHLTDKTIDKYSLVLFDFDKSDVSRDHQLVLENSVLPAIKSNSKVTIYGYTDVIGDSNHNRELSLKRAETVRDILQSKAKEPKYEVHGIGESEALFDNVSPIGRHLSRTVQIVIETPKQ